MKKTRYFLAYCILLVMLIGLLILNIMCGSLSLQFDEIIKCLFGKGSDEMVKNVVLQLRFPRALAAMILGGALGLAGYLLQTFFHNPIAGPFVLGISSGSKLIVALCMIVLLDMGVHISSFEMIMAAFLGAVIVMGFVMLMSRIVNKMSMLIVSGVMVGYICTAITDILITFADDSDIVNLHNWSKGSFSGMTWENVLWMAIVVGITSFGVFLLAKPISAYQMGENFAKSMGINQKLFKGLLVFLSSILAATITAFAGPVSFVGIAVPHLVKNLFHTTRPIYMIPACFLGGSVFCLFCDLIARCAFAPTEVSISTVTAVFGAPVVIWILLHKKGGEKR